MKSFIIIFTSLLALAASACRAAEPAELAENQIDDDEGERPHEAAGFGRGDARASYAVRACKPCAGQSQCQVMGMQRFAEPRCEPLGGPGAPCRPFQEAENKTLSFPNELLHCSDVYMQFCPCARGLVCDLERAECRARRLPTTSSTTTRRPREQAARRNFYQFEYAKPERYSAAAEHPDEGFGEPDEGAPLAPLVPMRPEESWGARRAPQWPWAVAARRLH